MGMRMRFTSEESSFEIDVPSEVAEMLERLADPFEFAGDKQWPEESGDDWGCVVSAGKLRQAFAQTRATVRASREDSEWVFTARARIMPGSDLESEGSGAIYGFRIDGQPHGLVLGLNQCTLEKVRILSDGTGEVAERHDVRDRDHIDTDDLGRITIKKHRAAGPTGKWVNKVLAKLKNMDGDVIVEVA